MILGDTTSLPGLLAKRKEGSCRWIGRPQKFPRIEQTGATFLSHTELPISGLIQQRKEKTEARSSSDSE